jgi:hypothetical protein
MFVIRESLCAHPVHFFIISRSVLFRMKNVSDKSCRENQNTHIVSSNFFFRKYVVYKVTLKIIIKLGRPQMKIWRMPIACWIPKATNTCSEHVIPFFLLQQWLEQRAWMLRCKYIGCISVVVSTCEFLYDKPTNTHL